MTTPTSTSRRSRSPRVAALSVVLVMLLAACMPVAGRTVARFAAPPEAIVASLAELAGTVRPGDDYTSYAVERIGDRQVVLRADWHPTLAVLFGGHAGRITFTLAVHDGTTLVAVDADRAALDDADRMLHGLERRFERSSTSAPPPVLTAHHPR